MSQRLVSSDKIELTFLGGSEKSPQLEARTLRFEDKQKCSEWLVRIGEIITEYRGPHWSEKPLLVFVNPFGGNGTGRLVWKLRVQPLFRLAGRKFERIYTKHGGHIVEYVSSLDLETFSGIVVVGGDGSVREAVNGLFLHRQGERAMQFPVGLIAAGSSNALAKARGLADPRVSAFHIVKGNCRALDAVRVTVLEGGGGKGRRTTSSLSSCPQDSFLSLCAVSLGFLSDVNVLAKDKKWRQLFGPARYNICGARRILFGGSSANYQANVKFRVRGSDEWVEAETDEASWDVLSPELWSRGEQRAKIAGEGLVLVTHLSTIRMLRFLSKFSSNEIEQALGDKYKLYRNIQAVEISTLGNTSNLPFSIDGELHGFKAIRLELMAGTATMFGSPTGGTEDETFSTAPVSTATQRQSPNHHF